MATLIPISFFSEASPVLASRDNLPLSELEINIIAVNNELGTVESDVAALDDSFTNHHKGLGSDPNGTPQVGVTHQNATALTAGFMSPTQFTKLSLIQDEAQVNALALVEALELVSRGNTALHRHRNADYVSPDTTPPGVYRDGFISAAMAARLASVAFGAQTRDADYTAQKPVLLGGLTGPAVDANAVHIHESQLEVTRSTPTPQSVSNVDSINFTGAGGLGVSVTPGPTGVAQVTLTQGAAPAPGPSPPHFHTYTDQQPLAIFHSDPGASSGTLATGFEPVGAAFVSSILDGSGNFLSVGYAAKVGVSISQGSAANAESGINSGTVLKKGLRSITVSGMTSSNLSFTVAGGGTPFACIIWGYATPTLNTAPA